MGLISGISRFFGKANKAAELRKELSLAFAAFRENEIEFAHGCLERALAVMEEIQLAGLQSSFMPHDWEALEKTGSALLRAAESSSSREATKDLCTDIANLAKDFKIVSELPHFPKAPKPMSLAELKKLTSQHLPTKNDAEEYESMGYLEGIHAGRILKATTLEIEAAEEKGRDEGEAAADRLKEALRLFRELGDRKRRLMSQSGCRRVTNSVAVIITKYKETNYSQEIEDLGQEIIKIALANTDPRTG